jgi:quercetin dioxygenase-like cupin family protein
MHTDPAHAPAPSLPPSLLPSLLRRAAEDAPTVHVAGVGVTVRTLVATAESGGALALLEYTAPPRFRGPAPHWHAMLTETFVGLDGAPVLHAGGEQTTLGPGAVVLVPPRVVHAFANPGDAPARFLVAATPGMGLEGYFAELATLIAASPVWPPADPTAVAALARRYDTFNPAELEAAMP